RPSGAPWRPTLRLFPTAMRKLNQARRGSRGENPRGARQHRPAGPRRSKPARRKIKSLDPADRSLPCRCGSPALLYRANRRSQKRGEERNGIFLRSILVLQRSAARMALGDASWYAAPVDHHSGGTGGEYPASSRPQPMVDNSRVCAAGKSDRLMGVRIHPMAQPHLGRWPAGVSSAVCPVPRRPVHLAPLRRGCSFLDPSPRRRALLRKATFREHANFGPLRRDLSCWNDPARPELSCCGSPSSANTRYTLCLLAPLRRGLFLSNHLGTISRVPGFALVRKTGEPSATSE